MKPGALYGAAVAAVLLIAGCGSGNGGPFASATTGSSSPPAVSSTTTAAAARQAAVSPPDYNCAQLRAEPARQYRLFAYVAHRMSGPNRLYTTSQAEHIARNVTEDLCTTYGPKIYPWNPGVALDKGFWTAAYSGGVSPDDPSIQGPIKPIGNCKTDPSCP